MLTNRIIVMVKLIIQQVFVVWSVPLIHHDPIIGNRQLLPTIITGE